MKNKKIIATGVFALFAMVTLALVLGRATTAPSIVQASDEGVSYHSAVVVYKNGELWDETHNIITNLGKEMLMNGAFYSQNVSEVRYIAVGGNQTYIPATWTAIGSTGGEATAWEYTGNGLTRALAARGWSGTGTQNMTLTYTFTASANDLDVNSTGLYNATVSQANGNTTGLFAAASFTNARLQSSDTLNITWFVWVA